MCYHPIEEKISWSIFLNLFDFKIFFDAGLLESYSWPIWICHCCCVVHMVIYFIFSIFIIGVLLIHHDLHDFLFRFSSSFFLARCFSVARSALELSLLQNWRIVFERLVLLNCTVIMRDLFARAFANDQLFAILNLLGTERTNRPFLIRLIFCLLFHFFFVFAWLFGLIMLCLQSNLDGLWVPLIIWSGSIIFSTLLTLHRRIRAITWSLFFRVATTPAACTVAATRSIGCISNSKKSFTFCCTTIASSEWSFEKVKLVIKGQFFILLEVLESEDANTDLVQHRPFSRLAIWITRMVDESSHIARGSRVNDFVVVDSHQVCACRVLIFLDALDPNIRIDIENLSNILHYKWILRNIFSSSQTPAFELGSYWVNKPILEQLKVSICAKVIGWARQHAAFKAHVAVDASSSTIQGLIDSFCLPAPLPDFALFIRLQHLWVFLRLLAIANQCLSISICEHILFSLDIFILFNWMILKSCKSVHSQSIFLVLDQPIPQELHSLLVLGEKGLQSILVAFGRFISIEVMLTDLLF